MWLVAQLITVALGFQSLTITSERKRRNLVKNTTFHQSFSRYHHKSRFILLVHLSIHMFCICGNVNSIWYSAILPETFSRFSNFRRILRLYQCHQSSGQLPYYMVLTRDCGFHSRRSMGLEPIALTQYISLTSNQGVILSCVMLFSDIMIRVLTHKLNQT